jgi:hypothetical protein
MLQSQVIPVIVDDLPDQALTGPMAEANEGTSLFPRKLPGINSKIRVAAKTQARPKVLQMRLRRIQPAAVDSYHPHLGKASDGCPGLSRREIA